MAELGINTVRDVHAAARATCSTKRPATACGSWSGCPGRSTSRSSTIARLKREHPPRDRRRRCASSAIIPRSSLFALGNEIPPGVVRWHGRRARRALPAQPVRGREGGVARQPVHLRQLPADRVPRSLVLRHLRVQRLPAPRAGAARVPRAAAAHRRSQAAAAGRSRRRQHSRRRGRSGRDHGDAHPRRRSTKARAARSRSPGPTNGGAAAQPSTTGRSVSSIAIARRSRRPSAVAAAFADAPFPARARRTRGRASRSSSARTTRPTRSTTA